MMTIKDKQLNKLFSHWYESKIFNGKYTTTQPSKNSHVTFIEIGRLA